MPNHGSQVRMYLCRIMSCCGMPTVLISLGSAAHCKTGWHDLTSFRSEEYTRFVFFLKKSCLYLFCKYAILSVPESYVLRNINMTQFKTKVPEWRCFVVWQGPRKSVWGLKMLSKWFILPRDLVASNLTTDGATAWRHTDFPPSAAVLFFRVYHQIRTHELLWLSLNKLSALLGQNQTNNVNLPQGNKKYTKAGSDYTMFMSLVGLRYSLTRPRLLPVHCNSHPLWRLCVTQLASLQGKQEDQQQVQFLPAYRLHKRQ